jgi:hypothetical protein
MDTGERLEAAKDAEVERRRQRRAKFNCRGATAAIIFAVVSLLAAANPHSRLGPLLDHDAWGKLIVAVWAVLPPVFFWVDWVKYCGYMHPSNPEREVAKHTHDLARNIWLGLLAVLTFSFFHLSSLG